VNDWVRPGFDLLQRTCMSISLAMTTPVGIAELACSISNSCSVFEPGAAHLRANANADAVHGTS
jgi:hypothetical protein